MFSFIAEDIVLCQVWFKTAVNFCVGLNPVSHRYCKMSLVPRPQAILLYHLSVLGFFTGLIGIHHDKPWLGFATCVCSFFAQNHWIDPRYGLRRNIDLAMVQVALWSHMWYAYSPLYVSIQTFGVACYCLSWYHQNRGALWKATLCHAMVHVCANASVLMYYLN